VQQPKNTRRKRRDDPAQLVFRFADSLVLENEALRSDNAALREKLIEIRRVMLLYAAEIADLDRNHHPPTSPAA
jgi:hypothetical protein